MPLQSSVTWIDGMALEASLDGHTFNLDADAEFGGRDRGPRPKGLLVTSLIGCTALDVIAILGKMRVPMKGLQVSATADLAAEHPKTVQRIEVRYQFTGDDLPPAKLRRAVQLSEERYCGVRATLAPVVTMTSSIWVNGERLP